jgi:hypothetical protein
MTIEIETTNSIWSTVTPICV